MTILTKASIDVSMENVTFSIFRWLKRIYVRAQLDSDNLDEVQESLTVFSRPSGSSWSGRNHPEKSGNSLQTVVDALKKGMNTRKTYSEEIMSHLAVSGTLQSRKMIDKLTSQRDITWRLCSNALHLGVGLHMTTVFGRKVLKMYSKCRLRMAHQFPETYSINDDPRDDGQADLVESAEQCDICDAQIDFEDAQWARCKEGHQFGKTCMVPRS